MFVRHLVFMFQLILFSHFEDLKSTFSNLSFPPTRYVVKGFRWLEFSNSLRYWNNFKSNIYVKSNIQICQLELPIIIIKLMCQRSLINAFSFVFCEFNLVANEMKSNLSFMFAHHFKFPNRNTDFFSSSTKINVNMSFPNSSFEGNYSTFGLCKSFWYYRELKIDSWTSRHILCEKSLNPFVCVEIIILVEKWNVYEFHIFPRPLLKTFSLETTSLCLNTRLFVNKKFPNSHYFYWN